MQPAKPEAYTDAADLVNVAQKLITEPAEASADAPDDYRAYLDRDDLETVTIRLPAVLVTHLRKVQKEWDTPTLDEEVLFHLRSSLSRHR